MKSKKKSAAQCAEDLNRRLTLKILELEKEISRLQAIVDEAPTPPRVRVTYTTTILAKIDSPKV